MSTSRESLLKTIIMANFHGKSEQRPRVDDGCYTNSLSEFLTKELVGKFVDNIACKEIVGTAYPEDPHLVGSRRYLVQWTPKATSAVLHFGGSVDEKDVLAAINQQFAARLTERAETRTIVLYVVGSRVERFQRKLAELLRPTCHRLGVTSVRLSSINAGDVTAVSLSVVIPKEAQAEEVDTTPQIISAEDLRLLPTSDVTIDAYEKQLDDIAYVRRMADIDLEVKTAQAMGETIAVLECIDFRTEYNLNRICKHLIDQGYRVFSTHERRPWYAVNTYVASVVIHWCEDNGCTACGLPEVDAEPAKVEEDLTDAVDSLFQKHIQESEERLRNTPGITDDDDLKRLGHYCSCRLCANLGRVFTVSMANSLFEAIRDGAHRGCSVAAFGNTPRASILGSL